MQLQYLRKMRLRITCLTRLHPVHMLDQDILLFFLRKIISVITITDRWAGGAGIEIRLK